VVSAQFLFPLPVKVPRVFHPVCVQGRRDDGQRLVHDDRRQSPDSVRGVRVDGKCVLVAVAEPRDPRVVWLRQVAE